MIQLSGCYSYKVISSAELPLPDSSKYEYIIHSQINKTSLENTIISNGVLSGRIVGGDIFNTGYIIHIYLLSDSVMKINTENILSVPLKGIAKVEVEKFDRGKTAEIFAVCTTTLIVIIAYIISNSFMKGNWMSQ
jgi:hypothetical protein